MAVATVAVDGAVSPERECFWSRLLENMSVFSLIGFIREKGEMALASTAGLPLF